MRFYNDRRPHRGHFPHHRHSEHRPPDRQFDPRPEELEPLEPQDPTSTGSEAAYFRTLIDTRRMVTVVLTTGDKVRGRVRYYDRDCFSVGPSEGGPNIFLRKSTVRCIYEE